MPIVIIPVGIAASGKSMLREKYMKEIKDLHVISPDDIRMRILDFKNSGKAFDKSIEPRIWDESFDLLRKYLDRGYDIFFDATNLTRLVRLLIIELIDKDRHDIIAHFLDIDLNLALLRNRKRDRKVPEDVLRSMFSMLEPPVLEEGFSEIRVTKQQPDSFELLEI